MPTATAIEPAHPLVHRLKARSRSSSEGCSMETASYGHPGLPATVPRSTFLGIIGTRHARSQTAAPRAAAAHGRPRQALHRGQGACRLPVAGAQGRAGAPQDRRHPGPDRCRSREAGTQGDAAHLRGAQDRRQGDPEPAAGRRARERLRPARQPVAGRQVRPVVTKPVSGAAPPPPTARAASLDQLCIDTVRALAEAHLAQLFNRPGHTIVDHCTYFLASDGDLMEGVSHEACSLAGHLKLGRLIGIYDDNRITIDGKTDLTFSDDTAKRFESYGWHVERVADGNDLGALDAALAAARRVADRPSLVIARTHIAYGSPHKQDTPEAHGAPLGEDEVKLTKQRLGWPSLEPFYVPAEALAHWRLARERGARLEAECTKELY